MITRKFTKFVGPDVSEESALNVVAWNGLTHAVLRGNGDFGILDEVEIEINVRKKAASGGSCAEQPKASQNDYLYLLEKIENLKDNRVPRREFEQYKHDTEMQIERLKHVVSTLEGKVERESILPKGPPAPIFMVDCSQIDHGKRKEKFEKCRKRMADLLPGIEGTSHFRIGVEAALGIFLEEYGDGQK